LRRAASDHDPTHKASADEHSHEHGDGCGHDHAMFDTPVSARTLEAELDTFLGTYLKDPKSIIWFKALTATFVICCAPVRRSPLWDLP
jgi:hypothetical protein